jgi:hypothetical protein
MRHWYNPYEIAERRLHKNPHYKRASPDTRRMMVSRMYDINTTFNPAGYIKNGRLTKKSAKRLDSALTEICTFVTTHFTA